MTKQWVPGDTALWDIDRFHEFCKARNRLLADALNLMLGLPAYTDANPSSPTLEEPDTDASGLDEQAEPAEEAEGDDVWSE